MKLKIGIVTSRFNEEITEALEEGAINFLDSLKDEYEIDVWSVRVPGAIEIPLACQALLSRGCQGVIALGAVIRGDTSHFDYVCNSVERGISQIMLETGKPIGFGVLTTENWEQAKARAGGEHGNKGIETAQCVVEMIGLMTHLNKRSLPPPLPLFKETGVKKTASKAKASKKAKNK
jgi:6,7-dimethyl-8-ribityllumazine synthase